MAYTDNPAVFNQAYELYLKADYPAAYDLLTSALPHIPEHAQRIFEWRFDIAARMGKLELSEQILNDALEEGCSYGEFTLRKDDDLQVMQGRPAFEQLVARSLKMLAKAQEKILPTMEVFNKGYANQGVTPLFMALHGNNSNIERFRGNWSSLLGLEWLVALPQSSQLSGKNIFVWNDMDLAEKELKAHYHKLSDSYKMSRELSILSGFSKGGHAAILATLLSWLPVTGFIAVAPYIGEIESWKTTLERTADVRLRGYFLLGGKDKLCTPGAMKLIELLEKRGIQCGVDVFPDLGHDFPDNFAQILPNALEFVLKRRD